MVRLFIWMSFILMNFMFHDDDGQSLFDSIIYFIFFFCFPFQLVVCCLFNIFLEENYYFLFSSLHTCWFLPQRTRKKISNLKDDEDEGRNCFLSVFLACLLACCFSFTFLFIYKKVIHLFIYLLFDDSGDMMMMNIMLHKY